MTFLLLHRPELVPPWLRSHCVIGLADWRQPSRVQVSHSRIRNSAAKPPQVGQVEIHKWLPILASPQGSNSWVGVFGVVAAELTQRRHFVTPDWVHAGDSVFDPVNVQAAFG